MNITLKDRVMYIGAALLFFVIFLIIRKVYGTTVGIVAIIIIMIIVYFLYYKYY